MASGIYEQQDPTTWFPSQESWISYTEFFGVDPTIDLTFATGNELATAKNIGTDGGNWTGSNSPEVDDAADPQYLILDGVDQQLRTATAGTANAQPFTVYALIEETGKSDQDVKIMELGNNRMIVLDNDGSVLIRCSSTPGARFAGARNFGTKNFIKAYVNGASSRLWVNGTEYTSDGGGTVGTTSAATWALGGDLDATFSIQGNIGLFGIIDGLGSDTLDANLQAHYESSTYWNSAPPVDRYATAADAAAHHQINVGDYIIEPRSEVRYETASGQSQIVLGPGQKLCIRGGTYDLIRLELDNVVGAEGNPVIITNFDGRVDARYILISGAQQFRFTGKYENGVSGDISYQGSFANGIDQHGQFGFKFQTPNNTTPGVFNMYFQGVAYNGSKRASDFELDHVECIGGFAGVGIKEDYIAGWPYDAVTTQQFHCHDVFIHDTESEGFYIGNTSPVDPQNRCAGIIENCVIVRTGGEAIQWGHKGPNCIERNNVVWGGVNWKNPFQAAQDGTLQTSMRQAGNKTHGNIAIQGAGRMLFYVHNTNTDVDPDPDQTGNFDEYFNNYFGPCRDNIKFYIGNNPPLNGASLKMYDNDFALDSFDFSEIYDNPASYAYFANVVGSGITTEYYNNRHETTEPLFFTGLPQVNEYNNTTGETIDRPTFVDWGFGAMDPARFERFTQYVLEFAYGSGARDNQYFTGDYIEYNYQFYRVLQDTSGTPPLPTGATDANYELLFGGGWPADDYRLTANSYHNLKLRGLVAYNEPSDLVFNESTVAWSPGSWFVETPTGGSDMPLAVLDTGENSILTKFGLDGAEGLVCPTVVLWGSSTAAGFNATAGNSFGDILQNYVEATLDGVYYNVSQSQYYTDRFLSDFSGAAVDINKNIDAVLALKPDIVVLSLPSNDQADGLNSQIQFMTNLVTIDRKLKENGVTMFVTTCQPRTGYNATEQARLRDDSVAIVNEFGLRSIDVFDLLRDTGNANPAVINPIYDGGDTIHLNDAGHLVLANTTIAVLESYYTDPSFLKYTLESGPGSDGPFTVLQDDIDPLTRELTFPRTGASRVFYRVRAQKTDLTFTAYSDVRSLEQPIFVGRDIDPQEVRLNFTYSQYTGEATYNDLVPANDATPIEGETFTNLLNVGGLDSGLSIELLDSFFGVGSGGPRLEDGSILPTNVGRSYWTFVDGIDNQEALLIRGGDPNSTFDMVYFASSNSDINRLSGIAVDGKSGMIFSGTDTGFNVDQTVELKGLKFDSNGEVRVALKSLNPSGGGIGRLNYISIRINANDDSNVWASDQRTLSGGTWFVEGAVEGPSTLTTDHEYRGPGTGQFMVVYTPPGYNDFQNQSKEYDFILFLHGAGERGSNINDLLNGGGPIPLINNGQDEPRDVIIAAPQLVAGAGIWYQSVVDDAWNYMINNYRINQNCCLLTGISLGGASIAQYFLIPSNGAKFVAAHNAAGAQYYGSTGEPVRQAVIDNDVQILSIHGTNDTVQHYGNTVGWADNVNPYGPEYPVEMIYIFGGGHSQSVWNTELYSRANRTDGNGTARFDYIDLFRSHSKDALDNAIRKVDYLDKTDRWRDYDIAKKYVDALSPGDTKNTLNNRLTAFRQRINRKRMIFNFGGDGTPPTGNFTNVSGMATGASYVNVVDEFGATTGITMTIEAQTASANRNVDGGTTIEGEYHGRDPEGYRYGMRCDVGVVGRLKFSGLDPALKYYIRALPTAGVFSFAQRQDLTIRSQSKSDSLYSQYNTLFDLGLDILTPDGNGEVEVEIEATGGAAVQLSWLYLEEEVSQTGAIGWNNPPGVTHASASPWSVDQGGIIPFGSDERQVIGGSWSVQENNPPVDWSTPPNATIAGGSWAVEAAPVAKSIGVNVGRGQAAPSGLPDGWVSVGYGDDIATSAGDTTDRTPQVYDKDGNAHTNNNLFDNASTDWELEFVNDSFSGGIWRQWGHYFATYGGNDLGPTNGYYGNASDPRDRHSVWVGNASALAETYLRIKNLKTDGTTYTIRIYGAQTLFSGTQNQTVTFGGVARTWNNYNANTLQEWTGVLPSAGTIEGLFENGNTILGGNGFAYLNAIEIIEE